MIRVNERGETRVWISESPAKNHRDFALATEEDAIAAVAGLAVRKNYEVANQLIGCRSISEAMHRLIRPRKTSSPYNNLSHRTIEGSFFRKDQQNIYKNVFH
jgi:ATP-dependent protease HslVU (ClpYQ) ATPase subunit